VISPNSAYTDTTGKLWSTDFGFNGGGASSTTNTIAGTPDQPLFQTWRWAPTSGPLIYTFSVPNGNHTVTLDFAENVVNFPGKRVFNVSINGTTVLTNFDIYQTVGKFTALSESFPVNVTTGQIVAQFSAVTGTPIVSAIAIQ